MSFELSVVHTRCATRVVGDGTSCCPREDVAATLTLRSVDTFIIHSLIIGLEGEVLSHGTEFAGSHSSGFFFWGHLKSLVYETPVDTDKELLGRVLTASLAV